MSYRRPDSFDIPIPKLSMKERVKIIDPKVTRARKRRQALLVLLLGLMAVGYVRRDVTLPWMKNKMPAVFAAIDRLTGEPQAPDAPQPQSQSQERRPQPQKQKPRQAARSEPPTAGDLENKLAVQQSLPVAPVALGAMKLEPAEYPAESVWPRQVSLTGVPAIEVTNEDPAAGAFVYRSPHYEFQSDTRLGADVVREFARVFEATHLAVCKLPLDLRPAPEPMRRRFTARLFKSEKEYLEAGGMEGSAGCYKRGEKCILVPLDSLGVKALGGGRTIMERGGAANATLIHEITHQMMNHWLPRLPVWFTEGAAEYMVVGDYLHGRFYFGQPEILLRQYLTRRRAADGAFRMLRPAELMALNPRSWSATLAGDRDETRQNYVSAVLLTFYFYHLDAGGGGASVIPYLRAVENGEAEHDACRDHLVRDRTVETLESDMKTAFRRLGFTLTFESRGGPAWEAEPKTPAAPRRTAG